MSVLNSLAARLAPQTVTLCRYFGLSNRCSSYSNRCSSSFVAVRNLNTSQRLKTDDRDPNPEDIQTELKSSGNDEIIQLAKYEYEIYKDERPGSMPVHVSDAQWEEIGILTSVERRSKYFHFLKVNENWDEKNAVKREARRAHMAQHRINVEKELQTNPHISYGLWRNSLTLKIDNPWLDRLSSLKMIRSKLLGESIIFDFDYEPHMNPREVSKLAKQFVHSYSHNKLWDDPFYLELFNYDRSSEVAKKLKQVLPNIEKDNTLMDLHSCDPLSLHRPQDLVIITGHSRADMPRYDPSLTYVIPAYVGQGGNKPHAIAKAKKLGVRHMRIPYDRYLHLGKGGRKDLPLNIVLNILLEVKHHGSWETAFRNQFPARMLDTSINGGFKINPSYSKHERRNVMRHRYGEERSDQKPYRNHQSGNYNNRRYDYSRPESSYNQKYDSRQTDNRPDSSYNQNKDSRQTDNRPESSYNQKYDSRQTDNRPQSSYNQKYDSRQTENNSGYDEPHRHRNMDDGHNKLSEKKSEKLVVDKLIKSLF